MSLLSKLHTQLPVVTLHRAGGHPATHSSFNVIRAASSGVTVEEHLLGGILGMTFYGYQIAYLNVINYVTSLC